MRCRWGRGQSAGLLLLLVKRRQRDKRVAISLFGRRMKRRGEMTGGEGGWAEWTERKEGQEAEGVKGRVKGEHGVGE